jgi:Response regulator
MYKYLLFILTLIVFDSCKHTPSHNKELLAVADSLVEIYPDSALRKLKQVSSLQLSSYDHALYALLMSKALDKCGQLGGSDSLIKIASSYFPQVNNNEKSAYAFLYQSRCARNSEDISSRAENLNKTIKFGLASNNNKLIGILYYEKAALYKAKQLPDSVIHYGMLALRIQQKEGDSRNIFNSLLAIGDGFYKKNNVHEALRYYKMAKHESFKIKGITPQTTTDYLISRSYYCLRQYDSALVYGRLSLKTKDKFDVEKHMNLGTIFLKKGIIDSAQYHLRQCLPAKNLSTNCYRLLQEAEEKQGNIKAAIQYSKLIEAAKDSDYQRSLATSSVLMKKKYNSEKAQVENKKLLIHNQQFTILAILSILLCFVVSTFVLIEKNRKRKLELQNEAVQNIICQQQLQLQSEQIKKMEILQKMIQLKHIPESNLTQIGALYLKLFGEDSHVIPANIEEMTEVIDKAFNGLSKKIKERYPHFTPREVQVSCCLRAGFDHGAILTIFDIKSETYYRYRSNIRKKMNAGPDDKIEQILSEIQ